MKIDDKLRFSQRLQLLSHVAITLVFAICQGKVFAAKTLSTNKSYMANSSLLFSQDLSVKLSHLQFGRQREQKAINL